MEVFEELALVSEYPSVYKYYSEFATDIILKKQDLDIALDF